MQPTRTASRPGSGRVARGLCAIAWLLLAGVPAADAVVGGERTLQLRGRVVGADGAPLAGARITTRGAARLATFSDALGRWTLSTPMGSAASFRRGPFSLEVRAEHRGQRISLASGSPALLIEVSRIDAGPNVTLRVRSSSAGAAAAIAVAYSQAEAILAWVDADFGGARRAGGTGGFTAQQDVVVEGPGSSALPPVARAPEASVGAVRPSRDMDRSRRDSLARERRRADSIESAAARERRQAALRARDGESAARRRADSIHWAGYRAARDSALAAAKARRDSTNAAKAAARAERKLAVAPPPVARPPAPTTSPEARPPRRERRPPPPPTPGPSVTPSSEALPAGVTSVSVVADSAPPRHDRRVVPIDTEPRQALPPIDSCRCVVRGTVEITWSRPLEERVPVRVTLSGPLTRLQTVQLFMGSPREFRFERLPCGAYRLNVNVTGRVRYAVQDPQDLEVDGTGGGERAVRIILLPQH